MSDYLAVGGCAVPAGLAPILTKLQAETGCSFVSVYRGDDAAALLHTLGKHTQRELWEATPAQRAAWGVLGTPNRPGTSTHELRSDGVAYPGPAGRALEWWQCGIDVDDAHVDAVMAAGARHGWQLSRPYPSGLEHHHLNLRSAPMSNAAKGCDHSNGGAIIGATLKNAGYTGILRYASEGRSDVNITHAEAADLKAHGIPVAIVCEHSANFLLGGAGIGAARAVGSRQVCRDAGLPDGVIYMAADFDATNGGPTSPGSPGEQNMRQILNALNGAAGAIGQANIGFYGSYYAIDWLVHNAPWIKYHWQTISWSHGNVHPKANVFQHADQTVRLAGVDLDPDDLLTADWGQRGRTISPTIGDADVATEITLYNADGRPEVWVIDAQKRPSHRYIQQQGGWSSWQEKSCPVNLVELVDVKHHDGHLEVIARGEDGRHYHNWQNGPNGTWQGSFTAFT